MSETYAAYLKGDRLEWLGAPPESEIRERGVAVEVTIVQATAGPAEDSERSRRMLEILERLAARGTLSEIDDSVAWQREIRQDRPLPGRKPRPAIEEQHGQSTIG